jgi:hypothetical protein
MYDFVISPMPATCSAHLRLITHSMYRTPASHYQAKPALQPATPATIGISNRVIFPCSSVTLSLMFLTLVSDHFLTYLFTSPFFHFCLFLICSIVFVSYFSYFVK